ncbi:MAG: hypothetical protein K2O99_12355 [Lachnospiraceae bacterium]|nr:hypothetical protein [Lachnospiraceae bacterium]
MKFLLVIGQNALYTYEKSSQEYEPVFIEGSEVFALRAGAIREEMKSYLEALKDEKNLGTTAKLEFDVLESADDSRNLAVQSVLEEHIDRTYPLDAALQTVMKKLVRDKELRIDKYGINYEGCSYKMDRDRVVRDAFDLLAYTIHNRDVVGLMNW